MTFENPGFMDYLIEGFYCRYLAQPLYRRHAKYLELRGDEALLDFGCGGGACTLVLLRYMSKESHITCLEPNSNWIFRAMKRLGHRKNIKFVNSYIEESGLQPGTFDAISVTYVLHDIDTCERQSIMNWLAILLKPGGRIGIWEPTKQSHGMPPEEIDKLARSAGLSKIKTRKRRNSYSCVFMLREKNHPIISSC